MIPKGTLVIVSDNERMESYIAKLLEDFAAHRRTIPAVKILWMLVYPRQTAIIDISVVTEMVPLAYGLETRMPFVCLWPLEGLPEGTYQQSVAAALADYIAEARYTGRYDVLAVLARHKLGEYGRARQMVPLIRY
ncbi:MAG: hypothetical protein ACOX7B_03415 [Christensenellales bacterium]